MNKSVSRILTIVALAIFAALAVAAIVLAVVKTDYNQVINSEVNGITVYQNGASNYYSKNAVDADDEAEFDKLMNKYYTGVKESVLSSLFQGAYSKDAKAEVVKSTGVSLSSITSSTDKLYIQFHFSKEQTLKINEKTYVDDKSTSLDKTVKYNSVILSVEDNTTLSKVTMYIVGTGATGSTSDYSYYQVKYATHHSALFDYITDLEFPGKSA